MTMPSPKLTDEACSTSPSRDAARHRGNSIPRSVAQGERRRVRAFAGRRRKQTASNLDLAADTFPLEFTDMIPLSNAAKALPDMLGSGRVRELREAA